MKPAKTLQFIKKAHAGQYYGSQPYYRHPLHVSQTGKKFFGSKFNEDAYNAALLHDVVEDTDYDIEDLRQMGFNEKVLKAVALLTKDSALSYKDNIKRIANSDSKIAMMVKFSDNYVNFTGDKSSWPEAKRIRSQKKYAWSLNFLGSLLGIKERFEYDE